MNLLTNSIFHIKASFNLTVGQTGSGFQTFVVILVITAVLLEYAYAFVINLALGFCVLNRLEGELLLVAAAAHADAADAHAPPRLLPRLPARRGRETSRVSLSACAHRTPRGSLYECSALRTARCQWCHLPRTDP